MVDDEEDFEDLFSFGASSTPEDAPPLASALSSATEVLSGSNISAGGTAGIESAAMQSSIERAEAGDTDDFDDLFGTPPPATVWKPHRALSDEFHVHDDDDDTRDMLEWLDDDERGTPTPSDGSYQHVTPPSNDSTSEGANVLDDYGLDFDQMIIDADVTAAHTTGMTSNNENESASQSVHSDVVENIMVDPNVNADIKHDTSKTNESIRKTEHVKSLSACIESELSFDQWADDDDDEMQDVETKEVIDESSDKYSTIADVEESEDASPTSNAMTSVGEITDQAPPEKIFSTLADAIRSSSSSTEDVQSLFSREAGFSSEVGVRKEDRSYLWAKVICNKVLDDIESGSLADSFREYQKKGEVTQGVEGNEYGAAIDSLLQEVCSVSNTNAEYPAKKIALIQLASFQCRNKSSTISSSLGIDSLILPVALAILETGIPLGAASVILSQIEPSFMPILRLENDERYLAAKALHSDFYLLACYHLPMLVMHLDRHCPGWYWPKNRELVIKDKEGGDDTVKEEKVDAQLGEESSPKTKKRDLEQNGLVPLSWFVTNFAGECGTSCLTHKIILPLWDNILTKGDHSWKYFLAIAVFDKQSDVLLMSRGDELRIELERVLNFQQGSTINPDADVIDGYEMSREWQLSAKSLMESTPSSVIELLRSADDRAVAKALQARQTKTDARVQAQQEAEEQAREKERMEREKEAEKALTKTRLIAYYRATCPEKIDTVDQILKMFEGRTGVLNDKLKNKYGKGFLPADEEFKDQTRNFLNSFSQSIADTKRSYSLALEQRRKKNASLLPESRSHVRVVLEVSATEVIPVIVATRSFNLATGRRISPGRSKSIDTLNSLHFYLVDCRPESIASEQGRFPTAVSVSPEKLQDPDELQKLTDMFESLRSSVHICVMGEGFASFPVLYNHSLSSAEEKLLEDDVARTSNCALFFLKKGFPFVSVLRGGFAAAHAFLSRNGPDIDMIPEEVLVEYDPSVSLFAQLEKARQEEEVYKNAPASQKTAMALQKIIDLSMVRLTLEEQRINDLANDRETLDTVKLKLDKLMSGWKDPKAVMLNRAPMNKKSVGSEEKTRSIEEVKDTSGSKLSSLMPSSSTLDDENSVSLSGPIHDKPSETLPLNASTERERYDDSKISATFASFSQLMQKSSINSIPASANAEDRGKSTISALAARLKAMKGLETKVSEKKDDSKVKNLSATTPSIVEGDNNSSVESTKKENPGVNISLSNFANRMKFGQQTETSNPSTAADKPVELKIDEGTKMFTEEANKTDELKKKFGQFTMSFGASLSGLQSKTAVDANVSSEKTVKGKEGEGGFDKFSKSMGGFVSMLQTKSDQPKQKRLNEVEEVLSFGDDEDVTNTTGSTISNTDGDELTDLFADVDLALQDVSLSNSGDKD